MERSQEASKVTRNEHLVNAIRSEYDRLKWRSRGFGARLAGVVLTVIGGCAVIVTEPLGIEIGDLRSTLLICVSLAGGFYILGICITIQTLEFQKSRVKLLLAAATRIEDTVLPDEKRVELAMQLIGGTIPFGNYDSNGHVAPDVGRTTLPNSAPQGSQS